MKEFAHSKLTPAGKCSKSEFCRVVSLECAPIHHKGIMAVIRVYVVVNKALQV